ncbi:fibronectin type III domain protein [Actinocrispum wychmicini]|uniref:Fibronectin type III domain protein n=2 Tax=Actinocrispum wychmicini TaxID=1213861 RepID=A0A4R2JY27_9PSEU|nr:fibronectin type III domain protein [Actinocrispum wychmicini]
MVASAVVAPATAHASAPYPPPGGLYTALPTPSRILDTRTATGGHRGQVRPDEVITVAVPGLPADATGAVINLTGTGGTAPTFLSVFPDTFAQTSTLNLATGQTAAVSAFVALGANRTIKILNSQGSVDVVADLTGYFATGSGSGFIAAAGQRLFDSRWSGPDSHPLGPGEVVTIPVRDRWETPPGVTAVVVNVTGVTPTAATYLAATPDGAAGTSTLNLDPGAIRANLAVVGIGADGAIRVRNSQGSTHVVVDVQGWFSPRSNSRYAATSPRRVLDTRNFDSPLPGGVSTSKLYWPNVLPAVPQTIDATVFNLTGVLPTANTYLAVDSGRTTSNVNLAAGSIVPNVVVSPKQDHLWLYNAVGTTDALVDLTGYFYTPKLPSATKTYFAKLVLGEKAALVQWYRPDDDGDAPVTSYTITAQPGGASVTVDASRYEVVLPGLSDYVKYTILVTANNIYGSSPPSVAGVVMPVPVTRVDVDAHGVPGSARSLLVAISGDGRYALITTASNNTLVPEPSRTSEPAGSRLLRKDLTTGEVIVVDGMDSGTAFRRWPAAISQDGSVVAYAHRDPSGPQTLSVRDLTSGTSQVVATTGVNRVQLSPDGRWTSWGSTDSNARGTIYRADWRAGQVTQVAGCDSSCDIRPGFAVSDDATKYVFEYPYTVARRSQLNLLDTVSGQIRSVAASLGHFGFAISGDGQSIVYSPDGDVNPSPAPLTRIATTPGANPVPVRPTKDDYVHIQDLSVSRDGNTSAGCYVGLEDYSHNVPDLTEVYDQQSQRELVLPVPVCSYGSPDTKPALSEDGSTVAFDTMDKGLYAVSVARWRDQ